MKPIRLTMQAFGSYGEKTVVDFTRTTQNLFLVTGNTGSGKSTVFDALVYALYGETGSSQSGKNGIELQSQFADMKTEPFVELCFAERHGAVEEEYTVRRVPRHIRNKQKGGEGSKADNERVTLTLSDHSTFSGGIKETDEKIEEIVGLTKDQFMQVAMIAQGEFMELLRAKTNDKKEIFRKLFDTGLYRDMVVCLSEKCKAGETELARIRTAVQTEIGHIMIPTEGETADGLTELRQRIITAKEYSVTDMEKLLDILERLCPELESKECLLTAERLKADKDRDDARDILNSGEDLEKAYQALETAQAVIRECEGQKETLTAKERLAEEIQKAYEIREVWQRARDAQILSERTEKEAAEEEKQLPQLTGVVKEKEKAEKEAEKVKNEALSSYTKTDERVRRALALYDNLERSEKALREAEVKKKTAEESRKAAEEARKLLEADMEKKRLRQEKLSGSSAALEVCSIQLARMKEIESLAERAERSAADAVNAGKASEEAQGVYRTAQTQYLDINSRYERANLAYLNAQAGILAREQLKEGEPCPVCGSLDHPHPCLLTEDASNLTREAIDALKTSSDEAREKMQERATEAGKKQNDLNNKLQKVKQEKEELFSTLSGAGLLLSEEPDFQEITDVIGKRSAGLKQEEKNLKADIKELEKLRIALVKDQKTKEELGKQEEKARDEALEAQKAAASAGTVYEELLKQKDFESREEADACLQAARKAKEAADQALELTQKQRKEAQKEEEGSKARLKKAQDALPEQREELRLRRETYMAYLQKHEMTDEAWKRLAEQYKRDDSKTLRAEADFERQKAAEALGSLQTAQKTIADRPRPDLKKAAGQLEEAEERLEALDKKLKEVINQAESNRKVLENLSVQSETRKLLAEKQSRLDSLFRRLSGKSAAAHMDIETYVQRYYMERILHAANRRFRDMSAGQFELRMVDVDKAGGNANRGLDLTVYSAVTGKEREINTLSGGESFMAALSMALGMADQIQENTASIHLDIMFIDEGFGSLDSHARGQAVRVLRQMAGGSKLVGIISHVTELKQEIDDQLLVTKDDHGSHVSWQIS